MADGKGARGGQHFVSQPSAAELIVEEVLGEEQPETNPAERKDRGEPIFNPTPEQRRAGKATAIVCGTQMIISMCHASLLLAGICIFGVMGGIKLKRTFLLAFIVMQLVYHPVVLGIAFGIAESGVICDIIKDDHACEILTDVYKWTTVGEAGLTVITVAVALFQWRGLRKPSPSQEVRLESEA